jgi:hypothetical protein
MGTGQNLGRLVSDGRIGGADDLIVPIKAANL